MNTIEQVIQRRRAEGHRSNRLIGEKSPYLLQHAFNPVDWYPWGDEAFEAARRDGKPIFLSIGYSTCYWCHVMEREVFENRDIAELMNRTVVSVKVDREERPDVDRVYMAALMGMTGSGGWPMSMFLTPDLKPFFGATYIPPTARHGREGFTELLTRIQELWTTDRGVILEAGDRLAGYLREMTATTPTESIPGRELIDRALQEFAASFDRRHGGFGGAPKFPTPVVLQFLLRHSVVSSRTDALEMALLTLDRMQDGGMADHVGGGFHRYATDAAWHVPHFEKMLYDQAQLAFTYLEAYQVTKNERYAVAMRSTLEYVARDLTGPEGGFHSAEDAESVPDPASPDEKTEGAFYVWSKPEIEAVLEPSEAALAAFVFDIRDDGNVSADPHGVFAGTNILHFLRTTSETADQFRMTEADVAASLVRVRRKLFDARSRRTRPGLDDKVLTSWNGLMISAFARAYQVTRDPAHLAAAVRAANFIADALVDAESGRLLHRNRAGESRFDAMLEDYAFMIQGSLDLYEASFDVRWLRHAIAWTEDQIKLFADEETGGFYDDRSAELAQLVRTKEWHDGATPSGNSTAVINLLRLSAMLHDERYRDTADRSLRLFSSWMERAPHGSAQWLSALEYRLADPRQVIVAGSIGDARTQAILRLVQSAVDPHRVVLLADDGEGQAFLSARIPSFAEYRTLNGRPTAYVCRDFSCQSPSSDLEEIGRLLGTASRGG